MKRTRVSMVVAILIIVTVFLAGCRLFGSEDSNGGAGGTTCTLIIDSPKNPADDGIDRYYRGFYITSYPGSALCRVDLWMSARTAGAYTLGLTAREDTYDGAALGTSETSVTFSDDQADVKVVAFLFDTVPSVPTGEVVTFELTTVSTPSGPDTDPFFALATDSPNGIVKETSGTSPPLDSLRGDEIAIRVYE
ncbi:MAG: hypothetical protein GVY14_14195 [Spirochaetes bacterium]|jgi:hypothetical protein|nr:hypothetical protein [Spirochaetota bacterium]